MWDKIGKYLPQFSSVILTSVDTDGYPYSLRCIPADDPAQKMIDLHLDADLALEPGPACLLFHKHDARLWNLKSFQLRGRLEQSAGGWRFVPERLIPGMGMEGLRSYFHFVVDSRRVAKKYLEKRGLPRPAIPWDELVELLESGRRTD